MNEDIEKAVGRCEVCQAYQKANTKEPLLPHPIPDRPWGKLGTDILEFAGKMVEVKLLGAKSAGEVIKKFEDVFATFGSPCLVILDNVTFNNYEFRQFRDPHFPRANGLAEKAVGIVKRMLCKVTECQIPLSLALLEYRNTPIAGIGLSPSQTLFHRRLKSKLPTHSDQLKPHIHTDVPARLQKYYFGRSSKSLPDLCPGQSVRIQKRNKWAPAAVLSRLDAPRSYLLKTLDGTVYRRNRNYMLASYTSFVNNCPSGSESISQTGSERFLIRNIMDNNSGIAPVSSVGDEVGDCLVTTLRQVVLQKGRNICKIMSAK
ncbi:hypothetical protein PR048_014883, partial [Dryococelus australis]